jgi:RNA polymerase sigma-70 factor, ECF subfamily
MNETDLLARAAAKDSAAFGALVRMHQSALRGFLLRLTRGDGALADDLAQETFLEAFRKIAQFRGDGSFAGWLYRIAWSRFLMQARRRKEESVEGFEEAQAAPHPEEAQLARLDLESAMAKIAPAERAALTLCFALGQSHEEAAMTLGLPLGTVKSHVLRGREKLRRLLQGWQPE